MKKRLSQILCLFMAFQVLLASMGFTVIEHLCKVRGKQTFVVSAPKCCLEKKELDAFPSKLHFKKTKCCQEHTSVYKINTNSQGGINIDFNTPILSWINHNTINYLFNSWEAASVSFRIPHFYDTAPPLAGRSLLIHIQTFLI
ncbi:MAG: HYC_CC_PP family protein [Spirosomataceae bacterium]